MSARGCRARARGFTLLEMMIAMAILSGALVWLIVGMSRNIKAENHAKLMTAANFLAREKMVDIEDELYDKGFGEFEKEQAGAFEDKGFSRFAWKAIVDKVELPSAEQLQTVLSNAQQARQTLQGGGHRSSAQRPRRGLQRGRAARRRRRMPLTAGASADARRQFGVIKDVLEQAIRRVTVKISWSEGRTPSEVELVAYYTDMRRVDQAIQIGSAAATGQAARRTGGAAARAAPAVAARAAPAEAPLMRRPQQRRRARGFTLIEVHGGGVDPGDRDDADLGARSSRPSTPRADRGAGRPLPHGAPGARAHGARAVDGLRLAERGHARSPSGARASSASATATSTRSLFSYFGHQRLYADANEADTALVSYYAARDRDDARKTEPDAARDAAPVELQDRRAGRARPTSCATTSSSSSSTTTTCATRSGARSGRPRRSTASPTGCRRRFASR